MGLHVIEICEHDGIYKERIHEDASRKTVDDFFAICKVGGWMFSNVYYLNGDIEIRGERKQAGRTVNMRGYFYKDKQSLKTSSHEFRTKKHKRESLIQK